MQLDSDEEAQIEGIIETLRRSISAHEGEGGLWLLNRIDEALHSGVEKADQPQHPIQIDLTAFHIRDALFIDNAGEGRRLIEYAPEDWQSTRELLTDLRRVFRASVGTDVAS